jgi:hypothetical protein
MRTHMKAYIVLHFHVHSHSSSAHSHATKQNKRRNIPSGGGLYQAMAIYHTLLHGSKSADGLIFSFVLFSDLVCCDIYPTRTNPCQWFWQSHSAPTTRLEIPWVLRLYDALQHAWINHSCLAVCALRTLRAPSVP